MLLTVMEDDCYFCFRTLTVLRKLKHETPYHVRKQRAESLHLKLDACFAFYPLP